MKLNPDLIPHSEFHKGVWLQSVERPSWYYFWKKPNPDKISNKDFVASLDEPLKDLVRLLHKRGIKTTPSCSGHHLGERDLEKIYRDIKEDEKAIRNGGLELKEVESGKHYTCKDKNYALPWNKKEFLEKLTEYQQKGVLGLKLGRRKRIREQLLTLNIDHVKVREKDNILFIFTKEDKEVGIRNTWKKITQEVKAILDRD